MLSPEAAALEPLTPPTRAFRKGELIRLPLQLLPSTPSVQKPHAELAVKRHNTAGIQHLVLYKLENRFGSLT